MITSNFLSGSIILFIFLQNFFLLEKNFEGITHNDKSIKSDSVITVTLSVVGDLMCHSPQFEAAKVAKDSFDFKPVFSEVKKYLSSSDFTFGNLETVTAGVDGGGYSGYPRFNTPASYISALADAGFDLLVTSNNHSLDRGENGIFKTISEINKNYLHYVGTYQSQSDRDSIRIFDVNGIRIGILTYSYGTNGNPIPKGKSFLINLIDFELIKNDILEARRSLAEIVLVHFHFGEEYKREPVAFQKEVVDKTISFGADIIIGGHPHVIQPIDFFKTINGKLDTGIVAYSMGNFLSNQRKRYTDAGIILTIKLKKDISENRVSISDVNYIPTWVYKGSDDKRNKYVILPSTVTSNISDYTYLNDFSISKMIQAFNDTREIISRYSNYFKLKEYLP